MWRSHYPIFFYFFLQPKFLLEYRDFNNKNQVIPSWQKDMARYCNIKSIYNSVDFKEYEPRKGFKCISYFS